MGRVDLRGLLEVGDGLVEAAQVPVHDALVGEHVRVVGVERQRLGVGVDGLLLLAGVEVVVAELDPDPDQLGVLGDQLLVHLDALEDLGRGRGGLGHPARHSLRRHLLGQASRHRRVEGRAAGPSRRASGPRPSPWSGR